MYSVLFVDDEPTAKIISQSMADWAKLRLKITAAVNNGAEALAYLESHEADAVITDLQMPVMDGLTLIRELRSRGFKGPILALSNYSEYNLVRGALTEGAYDYLIKIDISTKTLETALQKMVDILDSQSLSQRPGALNAGDDSMDALQRVLIPYFVNMHAEPPQSPLVGKLSFPISAYLVEVLVPRERQGNLRKILYPCCSDLFSDYEMFFMQVSGNEFLILVSDKGSCDVSKKGAVLYRQIRTLLSADALICCASCLSCLEVIQRFYRFGSHGNVSVFYGQRTGVVRIYPENTQAEYHLKRESFISSLLSSLRVHDAVAVRSQLEDFVVFCAKSSVEPYRVKNTISILLWCAMDIGAVNAEMPAIRETVVQIDRSENAQDMIEAIMDFFAANIQFVMKQNGHLHPEVAKALLYIHKNYPQKITLTDIAQHVGLCNEYISRLFLKEMGINLFQYISKVRMIKAGEILQNSPSVRIKKVSSDVGFDNPYFFSSKFKEFYGVSPNQYRNTFGSPDGGAGSP